MTGGRNRRGRDSVWQTILSERLGGPPRATARTHEATDRPVALAASGRNDRAAPRRPRPRRVDAAVAACESLSTSRICSKP